MEGFALARELVLQAGAALRESRLREDEIQHKSGYQDLVTRWDKETEQFLRRGISEAFPQDIIVGEEYPAANEGAEGCTWYLDPIDGTTNYLYGARHSCISLALYYRKQGLIGVVYNPYRDECFLGIQGQGSWCNDKPIHVSSHGFSEALVMVGTAPYDKSQADTIFDIIKELFLETRDIRRSGSAALDLCDLACGRVDAFYEHMLQPWDYGAGRIILENAQGKIEPMTASAFDALKPTGVICSNGICQDDLRRVIEKHLA